MKCDAILELLPLYYYGELTGEEEELVDKHLPGCLACARALEQQRRLAAALDRRQIEVPALLAEDCQAGLMAAVRGGAPLLPQRPARSRWQLFWDAMTEPLGAFGRLRQPVGAMCLVALGFVCARFVNPTSTVFAPSGAATEASLVSGGNMYSTVRSIQPLDSNGQVRIAFDETRRRVISGRMDDADIRSLLLAGAREEDSAVRAESVEVLKGRAQSEDVRQALLDTLTHDPNGSLRLKALEGLRPVAHVGNVHTALAQVLLGDENPAVRLRVLDILASSPDTSAVGAMQVMVQQEDNGYVRQRCEKALKEMNASVGTF
jgi:hypothetical protein